MSRRFRLADDSGSALVFALIFVGIWSIVVLAILTFAEAGYNLAAGSGEQREEVYAAEGGVEAAIARLAWWDEDADGPIPADPDPCMVYTHQPDPEDPPLEVEVLCDEREPLDEEDGRRVIHLTASVEGQPRLMARVTFAHDVAFEDGECIEFDEEDPPTCIDWEEIVTVEYPASVSVDHWRPLRAVAP